jgi:endonuclease/exonuclease/phosphatase family metal-dependent hydrolase
VAEEGQGSLAIPVNLAYAGNAAVQFRFVGPTNGTARRGADFNCATTLVISGTTSNLMVEIVDDLLAEGPESILIQLVPVAPAVAGAITQAVLHIRDNDTVAILAANTTSGSYQEYEEPGNRIFQALSPDVVLIQEFNMTNGTSAAAYRAWVDQNFGTDFQYCLEPVASANIPNGIVSRWPISAWGEWDDPHLLDRDFVWAKIEMPGYQDLYAVSVHLKASSGYEATRTSQARVLTNLITQAGWLTNGYVVIGGDFNLQTRTETALAVLTAQIVSDAHQAADQFGDKDTNSGRNKPYDLVLPSTLLDARHRSFSFYGYTYPNGIVYDSRITWADGLPPPSLAIDSAAVNMQHMAVMKVFELEKDDEVDAPQAFAAAPAGPAEVALTFTRNTLGDDVLVVWNTTGVFTAPTGTAPAVGAPFAGGTVLYKGGVSPQAHAGLDSCATYHYACWSFAGAVYSETGLTASATTTEPAAPAAVWAGVTNVLDFTAAWSPVAGATAYRLDVSGDPGFSGAAAGWVPVFRETMGTSAGTTALAAHEAADGFDNDAYTMSAAGADNPADVRSTSVSSNYFDPAGNPASGAANIYFTTTGVSGAVGFGIEGIDSRGYEELALSFGYRKEFAASNMAFSVEWSTNSGATWNGIALSNLPAADAAVNWYMVSNLAVSAAATGSTNLSLRWVRESGAYPGRIDDILLQGYSATAGFVSGYSNRTVTGATSQAVTGLTAGATVYFRVAAVSFCTGTWSSAASVTTLSSFIAPEFSANPGPFSTTVGVAVAFSVGASGNPAPVLALSSASVASGFLFHAESGEFSYVPAAADLGPQQFLFTASNTAGVATQTVQVTVADIAPEAPAFTSGTTYATTTGVALAFSIAATGYPAPTLALAETTATGGYSFTPATGALAYTPPEADVGAQTFTFTAANASGVATQTVTISVAAGVPSAPLAVWASATNATGFTAAWLSVAVATGYRLDVSTNADFQIGGGPSVQAVLATNAATSPALITNGWSGTDLGGTTYLILTQATSEVTTPAFSTEGVTNLTVDFQARTYGGTTFSNITISISTNDGADWAVIGVVNPVNGGTMAVVPTLVHTTWLGHVQTRIRWQSLDATGTIGVGVRYLQVKGWAPSTTPSYVPGYSNLSVVGTSQTVVGLAEGATYYFRVRAANAAGTSGHSATASVLTGEPALQNQMIDFPVLGAQVATNVLVLTATASSGLPVSFAVAEGPATISSGANLSFTGAGTVSIVASQAGNAEWNPAPDITNTFTVTKAFATVVIGDLTHMYDGGPKSATATTTPAGLTVGLTYNGSSNTPAAAGTYAVTGTVYEALYQGTASATLQILTLTNVFINWLDDRELDPENPDLAPDEDLDGDGMTTWEEFLADTDPTLPGSVLALTGRYFTAAAVGRADGRNPVFVPGQHQPVLPAGVLHPPDECRQHRRLKPGARRARHGDHQPHHRHLVWRPSAPCCTIPKDRE